MPTTCPTNDRKRVTNVAGLLALSAVFWLGAGVLRAAPVTATTWASLFVLCGVVSVLLWTRGPGRAGFGDWMWAALYAAWLAVFCYGVVRGLGGCRAWGVDSENRPKRGQFLPDLQPHSPAMGQKAGEKWTAAVDLQPTLPKSDSLLDTLYGAYRRRAHPEELLGGLELWTLLCPGALAVALSGAARSLPVHRWVVHA